jgi:putative nucleotidyltransferase with HDIG domain
MSRVLSEMDRHERLRLCINSMAAKDDATSAHCSRVTELVDRLATALGIGGATREHLRSAAMIHDIGKLAVPQSILLKPGRLDENEWHVMRQHPTIGARLAARLELPRVLCEVVLHHHEHWDGGGYPYSLRGRQIPLSARIMCVADVFDALTSDRSYRSAYDTDVALFIMERECGSTLDPDIFRTFCMMLRGENRARIYLSAN